MNLKLLSSSQGATENENKIYALEFQLRALPFKLRRYVLFGHPFFFFFPGTCVMRLRLIVPNLLHSMHVHDSYFRKESNV